jgi:glutathione S-transferase
MPLPQRRRGRSGDAGARVGYRARVVAELVVLHVSPWSERARWALDHHHIAFREKQHAPFLGELGLRRLRRSDGGRATVPVLCDGDTVICDSWDIARHADATGSGTTLIPGEHAEAIRAWVRRIDEASAKGRALVIRGMLANDAALDEGLPPPIPGFLRPLMRPFTRFGTRWFGRKYQLDLDAVAENEDAVRAALRELRERIGGGRYAFGAFSYADIVSATFLQGIAPVADEYIRLGPATREVWHNGTLASEFEDLVRWRDALYRDHRRP